jgi:hypothetical protein
MVNIATTLSERANLPKFSVFVNLARTQGGENYFGSDMCDEGKRLMWGAEGITEIETGE